MRIGEEEAKINTLHRRFQFCPVPRSRPAGARFGPYCGVIIRQMLVRPESALQQRMDLAFKSRVAGLYDEIAPQAREIYKWHANAGIAETPKAVTQIVDLVDSRLRTLTEIFKEVYIDPFEGTNQAETIQEWLLDVVSNTINTEVERAQLTLKLLRSPLIGTTAQRYDKDGDTLLHTGAEIKHRLRNSITLMSLGGVVNKATSGSKPTSTTEKSG